MYKKYKHWKWFDYQVVSITTNMLSVWCLLYLSILIHVINNSTILLIEHCWYKFTGLHQHWKKWEEDCVHKSTCFSFSRINSIKFSYLFYLFQKINIKFLLKLQYCCSALLILFWRCGTFLSNLMTKIRWYLCKSYFVC